VAALVAIRITVLDLGHRDNLVPLPPRMLQLGVAQPTFPFRMLRRQHSPKELKMKGRHVQGSAAYPEGESGDCRTTIGLWRVTQ
jgi:hypothetical protein